MTNTLYFTSSTFSALSCRVAQVWHYWLEPLITKHNFKWIQHCERFPQLRSTRPWLRHKRHVRQIPEAKQLKFIPWNAFGLFQKTNTLISNICLQNRYSFQTYKSNPNRTDDDHIFDVNIFLQLHYRIRHRNNTLTQICTQITNRFLPRLHTCLSTKQLNTTDYYLETYEHV